jgi:NAD(P)-dependent dehydrogenase (short-subunit alcohol dehydrogenase family)
MLPLDVTSDESVEAAVSEVIRLDGRIDLLVNNAGFAARPKVRYAAGKLANRLRFLRRFAPASMVDAGIRKDLRLDTPTASQARPARASI